LCVSSMLILVPFPLYRYTNDSIVEFSLGMLFFQSFYRFIFLIRYT
jgi:hypothetical protein